MCPFIFSKQFYLLFILIIYKQYILVKHFSSYYASEVTGNKKWVSKLFGGVTIWWTGLVGLHFSSLDWWAGLVGQQFQTEFKKRQVDVCLESRVFK